MTDRKIMRSKKVSSHMELRKLVSVERFSDVVRKDLTRRQVYAANSLLRKLFDQTVADDEMLVVYHIFHLSEKVADLLWSVIEQNHESMWDVSDKFQKRFCVPALEEGEFFERFMSEVYAER